MLSWKNYDFGRDGFLFELKGKPMVSEQYEFWGKAPVCAEEYLVLRYRAQDLQRINEFTQPLLLGKRGEEEFPLLCAKEMIFDGFSHLAIAAVGGNFDRLGLRLHRRAARATFEILDLYTCSAKELPARFEQTAAGEGCRPIDLSSWFNSSLPQTIGAHNVGCIVVNE